MYCKYWIEEVQGPTVSHSPNEGKISKLPAGLSLLFALAIKVLITISGLPKPFPGAGITSFDIQEC